MIDRQTGRITHLHAAEMIDPRRAMRIAWFVVAFTCICALGVVVRAKYLGGPMRYDESYNYVNYVVRGPLYITTHYVPNNQILHTLCVWGGTKLAGNSPAALRLPAFLAGMMLIPATAWLAWMVSSRFSVVLLSALAVSCSSALIEYSVNARGYSMLALFAVLGCITLLQAIRLAGMRWLWFTWGLLGTAGMYTVPIMALPLLGMAAWCVTIAAVTDAGRRAQILRGLALGLGTCAGLTLLAYSPIWLKCGFAPFVRSRELIGDILGRQIPTSTLMLSSMGDLWTRHMPVILICMMGFGVAVYLARSIRCDSLDRWLLPAIVLVPILLAAMMRVPLPARTWLFALPFILVLSAKGLDEIVRSGSDTRGLFTNKGLQVVAALTCLCGLVSLCRAGILCSEPGGLVLIEPALEECQSFGANRCALVAPYNPSIAYYKGRGKVQSFTDPEDPGTERVYVVTNQQTSLDDLWHPGTKGFDLYGRPRLLWQRDGGSLYMAERVERNALR